MKIYWKWFVGLLAFEFLFALSVHGPVLTSHPWLNVFVHAAERIAPVIGRFDSVAKDPEAVRTFLALTVMLLPLHVAFFFIWLNSSFTAIYRHLVISPRTKQSARDVGSFVTAPLDDEDTPQAGRERSLLSRILW